MLVACLLVRNVPLPEGEESKEDSKNAQTQ
jgi:hypothetical protein